MLSAIIGIPRGENIDGLYSKEYLDFLKATRIGIELINLPRKMVFFTNHISFKESKTKPSKIELLTQPEYKIYFTTDKQYEEEIVKRIPSDNRQVPEEGYVYTPYLGEAFCLAELYGLNKEMEFEKINDAKGENLAMKSTFIEPSEIRYYSPFVRSNLLFEYHLLHRVEEKANNEILNKTIVKYYIPILNENGTSKTKESNSIKPINVEVLNYDENICIFYENKNEGTAICLF